MAEYIDQEAAISLIKQYGKDVIDDGRYSLDTVDDCIELANRIETLPTADVAPVVHGWWKHMDGTKTRRVCSMCGWDVPEYGKFYVYCPNCGAKMDGGGNDGNV